jgi:acyl-coenzyme A synthetase/AMP-(fatty) acid ligase
VPRKVFFVESLPMSASAKFLKFKLRERFSKSPDVPGKERIL